MVLGWAWLATVRGQILQRLPANLTKPSSGTIRLDGVNLATSPDALRCTLGYLPQDFGIYPHLSASELLEYILSSAPVPWAAFPLPNDPRQLVVDEPKTPDSTPRMAPAYAESYGEKAMPTGPLSG